MEDLQVGIKHKVFSFISRTSKSRFVRNVVIVASGTAAAQVITMLFSPLVTRLYGPEAFGLLGVFNSITAMFIPVVALAYPIAIVLPKNDKDAYGLAKISILITIIFSALFAILLLFSGSQLLSLFDSDILAPYSMLIPMTLFFAGLIQVGEQWVIRKKYFDLSAKVAVSQSFLLNIGKVGMGLFYPFGIVLIMLSTFGKFLHMILFLLGIKSRQNMDFLKNNDNDKDSVQLRKLAIKYFDFPAYRAPQVFINAVSQSLPVLMLASFFGPASAGFYTLCKTVLAMPSRLIGKAVADVFYPRITEAAYNEEDLSKLILKGTGLLALVGFMPFLILILFGPQLFSFVFGDQWIMAGQYAKWLGLWMFFGFINRPSIASIAVLRLQGFFLSYEIISVVSRVIALFFGAFIIQDDLVAVSLFSMVGTFLNIFLISATFINAKQRSKRDV